MIYRNNQQPQLYHSSGGTERSKGCSNNLKHYCSPSGSEASNSGCYIGLEKMKMATAIESSSVDPTMMTMHHCSSIECHEPDDDDIDDEDSILINLLLASAEEEQQTPTTPPKSPTSVVPRRNTYYDAAFSSTNKSSSIIDDVFGGINSSTEKAKPTTNVTNLLVVEEMEEEQKEELVENDCDDDSHRRSIQAAFRNLIDAYHYNDITSCYDDGSVEEEEEKRDNVVRKKPITALSPATTKARRSTLLLDRLETISEE